MRIISYIKAIGTERRTMSGDFGNIFHVKGIGGDRILIQALLGCRILKENIIKAFKDNPAKLLWLEE